MTTGTSTRALTALTRRGFNAEKSSAAGRTDRGHLTRYLDVAWGTKAEALKALADTFHFTNCCLQLSGFNQTQARWQGIEQFLLERKAKKDKMRISVITGPIFKRTRPEIPERVHGCSRPHPPRVLESMCTDSRR